MLQISVTAHVSSKYVIYYICLWSDLLLIVGFLDVISNIPVLVFAEGVLALVHMELSLGTSDKEIVIVS